MKGRIRTIKPEIALDEDLWRLCEEMPTAPVFQVYTMLWCHADREGRFEWRPIALKVVCCPYWSGDFDLVLRGLERYGKVLRYEVDGKQYGIVKNLKVHQAFNNREPASKLPPPPGILKDAYTDSSAHLSTHVRAPEEGTGRELEGNGREGEGRVRVDDNPPPASTVVEVQGTARPEREPTRPDNPIPDRPARAPGSPPASRRDVFRMLAPSEWTPSAEGVAYARELGLDERAIEETITELRNKRGGGRAFSVDWWDDKWVRFVEQRAKNPKRGSREAPPTGDPLEQARTNLARKSEAGVATLVATVEHANALRDANDDAWSRPTPSTMALLGSGAPIVALPKARAR